MQPISACWSVMVCPLRLDCFLPKRYTRPTASLQPPSPLQKQRYTITAGRVSSYLDKDVIGGTPFYYVLRSRDAAGNEHQSSSEVSAVPIAHPRDLDGHPYPDSFSDRPAICDTVHGHTRGYGEAIPLLAALAAEGE